MTTVGGPLPGPRSRAAGGAGVVLLVIGWVAFALDPADAEFFVPLGEGP